MLLVFSYQFTANCLSLPPPLLGGAISKPLTLPFALAFRTNNIKTVVKLPVEGIRFSDAEAGNTQTSAPLSTKKCVPFTRSHTDKELCA